MRRLRGLTAPAILVAALAACTPVPQPDPGPSPTPTAVRPTPKPTPTVTLPPLAIPRCDELLPIVTAREVFSPSVELFAETPASEFVAHIPVQSIPVVLSTASPSRACLWAGPNSDGSFSLVVAGITGTERETLQSELTAEGFTETTTGDVAAFELERDDGGLSSYGATHLFSNDAWILSDNRSLSASRAVAAAALEALRAANPALGL